MQTLGTEKFKKRKVNFVLLPGLPDFSGHIIPKRGKVYQTIKKLPNVYEKCKIALKFSSGHTMRQPSPFQGPPKFSQIGIFWLEKIPSGNPVYYHGGSLR
jgi:hypothetical protein